MNQSRDERSDRTLPEHADELGEQVGRLFSSALRGIEDAVRKGVPGQASHGHQVESSDPAAAEAAGALDRSAMKRAEQLLDSMGGQFNRFALLAGPRVRKLAALAREETEDIWAEAQHLRRTSRRDSGHDESSSA